MLKTVFLALAVLLSVITSLATAQTPGEAKKAEAYEKIVLPLAEVLVNNDPPIWTSDARLKDSQSFREYARFKEINPKQDYPLVRYDNEGNITGTEMVMGAEVRLSLAQLRASTKEEQLSDKGKELLQQAMTLVPMPRARANVLGYWSFLRLANRAGEKKINR